MLERLFPREGHEFFDFFESLAEIAEEAAGKLRAVLADPSRSEEAAAEIKALEERGDDVTHRAIALLHSTFLTPIERSDIHALISRQDDVLDLVDSTAERFWLYGIRGVEDGVLDLADVLVDAVSVARRAVGCLRHYRSESSRLLEFCRRISQLEKEGDRLRRHAMARLFANSADPVHVLMWKEIVRFLEDAIDRCEDVANVLEGVALAAA
jgi:hypothetical protein